jgi:hypothetical protein
MNLLISLVVTIYRQRMLLGSLTQLAEHLLVVGRMAALLVYLNTLTSGYAYWSVFDASTSVSVIVLLANVADESVLYGWLAGQGSVLVYSLESNITVKSHFIVHGTCCHVGIDFPIIRFIGV